MSHNVVLIVRPNILILDHIEIRSEGLLFDLKFTQKKAKDKLSKVKRKLHLARKERFETRKRKRVNALNKDVYKLKWEPQNQTSKKRLETLKKIREQEQDREFER